MFEKIKTATGMTDKTKAHFKKRFDDTINIGQTEMMNELENSAKKTNKNKNKVASDSMIDQILGKLFKKDHHDNSGFAISTIILDNHMSSEKLNTALKSKRKKIRSLPARQVTLTGLAIVAAIGAGIALNARSNYNEKIALASAAVIELQGTARNLPKLANSAAFGDKSSIESIERFSSRIEDNTKKISLFIDDQSLNNTANETINAVQGISSRKNKLYGVGESLIKVRASGEMVRGAAEQMQGIVMQKATGESTALMAARLRTIASRMNNRIEDIVSGSSPVAAINAFNNDISAVQEVMLSMDSESLMVDPDISGRMSVLKRATSELKSYSTEIKASLLDVVEARRSANLLNKISETLITASEAASKNIESSRSSLSYYQVAAALLALLSLGLLANIFLSNVKTEKLRAKRVESEKRKTESAIERILGEIMPISGGDLRTRITVTTDPIGVIADAVNLTVDELSRLVKDINISSVDVQDTTNSFVKTIEQIAVKTSEQASKFDAVNQSVTNLTESINHIATSADRSYEVAQKSLQAADNGVNTVKETIDGMNQIRDNIAETSKRVKRLGESSQEIGEIADVIVDITNKTNILALNAFIQAAGAGENGRGFTIIAAEIQKLSKRSNESLDRVNELIQAIQNDMREAILAMERSTNGVVNGAVMANSAGDALKSIKDISENLADLIAGISNASRSQAMDAQKVSQNMQQVLEIAKDSSGLASQSKVSVVKISMKVDELSKSVAGFQTN